MLGRPFLLISLLFGLSGELMAKPSLEPFPSRESLRELQLQAYGCSRENTTRLCTTRATWPIHSWTIPGYQPPAKMRSGNCCRQQRSPLPTATAAATASIDPPGASPWCVLTR